jgi:hypothetical protein
MIVSSGAIKPASTKDADARKSEVHRAPVRGVGPSTVALAVDMNVHPYDVILKRMNRFSKTVSTISDLPIACVIRTMYCACMSVGKSG